LRSAHCEQSADPQIDFPNDNTFGHKAVLAALRLLSSNRKKIRGLQRAAKGEIDAHASDGVMDAIL
jgi:hypothetical protein